MEPRATKPCAICGDNCEGQPRTKDGHGRYYHQACYEKAIAARRTKPAPPRSDAISLNQPGGLLAELVEQAAPHAGSVPPDDAACPACGFALASGAILCTNCGHNLQTGEKLQTRKRTSPRVGVGGATHIAGLLSPGGIALVALAAVAILYVLSLQGQPMMLMAFGVLAMFSAAMNITVLVFAFMQSVGQGFLTLCVPCYVLYFLASVCENNYVRYLWVVAFIGHIALYATHFNALQQLQGAPGF